MSNNDLYPALYKEGDPDKVIDLAKEVTREWMSEINTDPTADIYPAAVGLLSSVLASRNRAAADVIELCEGAVKEDRHQSIISELCEAIVHRLKAY